MSPSSPILGMTARASKVRCLEIGIWSLLSHCLSTYFRPGLHLDPLLGRPFLANDDCEEGGRHMVRSLEAAILQLVDATIDQVFV